MKRASIDVKNSSENRQKKETNGRSRIVRCFLFWCPSHSYELAVNVDVVAHHFAINSNGLHLRKTKCDKIKIRKQPKKCDNSDTRLVRQKCPFKRLM